MSSTKWNFRWFISEAWLLEKWTSGKRKKAKTENESQSVSKKRKQSDKKDHQFLPVYGKEIIKTNKKKDAHIRCSLVTLIQKETNVESFEGTYYISREIWI